MYTAPADRSCRRAVDAAAQARGRGPATRTSGRRPHFAAFATRTGVNNDSLKQPDAKLRALNTRADDAGRARRKSICTKVGTTHPRRCTSSAAHMDGIGWGEAANDDGSGTALVMELARVFSSPDVKTERSIRFALWNNEETGLERRARLRRAARGAAGQGEPAGSGKYPEPKWLGMIQHDMMMFDHGMPRADGTHEHRAAPRSRRQHRVSADTSKLAPTSAMKLAWFFADGEREIRHRLSGARRAAHDQHRLGSVPGSRPGDQPSRERARRADRRRLGSALASADRRVHRRTTTRISGSA